MVHFRLLAALLLLLLLSDRAAGAVHARREAESSRTELDLEGHVGRKEKFAIHLEAVSSALASLSAGFRCSG